MFANMHKTRNAFFLVVLAAAVFGDSYKSYVNILDQKCGVSFDHTGMEMDLEDNRTEIIEFQQDCFSENVTSQLDRAKQIVRCQLFSSKYFN